MLLKQLYKTHTKHIALSVLAVVGSGNASAGKSTAPQEVKNPDYMQNPDYILGYGNGYTQALEEQPQKLSDQDLTIQKPKPLTQEQKKVDEIDYLKKLKLNYIGDIPLAIENLISYHYFFIKNNSSSKDTLNQSIFSENSKDSNTMLLYGDAGKGKNYLVQELSRALQIPHLSCLALDFQDGIFGETNRRTKKVFDLIAQQKEPVILFIDEIDSSAAAREQADMGAMRSALTSLLSNIEKIRYNKNVYIFIATNHKEHLDEAILSRFTEAVEIKGLTTIEHYQAFFKKSARNTGAIISDKLINNLAKKVFDSHQDWDAVNYSFRDMQAIIPTAIRINMAKEMQAIIARENVPQKTMVELHTITNAEVLNAALATVDASCHAKIKRNKSSRKRLS